jgi:anti-sigma factor RsiW
VDCEAVRERLLDAQAGRLPSEVTGDVLQHIRGCDACAHEDVAERTLTEVLERRLPQHPASLGLKRRLAAEWSSVPARRAPSGGWSRWLMPAAAAALVLVVALPAYLSRPDTSLDGVVSEAVNDHLRVLQPDRSLDVTDSGMHQVRPWFAGRLDFAPVVPFAGDAEYPLRGGTVEYFLDRRAAVFVFERRLHTISLFVFRPEGVPMPARERERIERSVRGFNTVLWRRGDLGYALVSDLNAAELRDLAERLSPPS